MRSIRDIITGRHHHTSLGELSRQSGIKYITLYQAIRTDRLDATRRGKLWFSSMEAIEQAVAEGKIRRSGEMELDKKQERHLNKVIPYHGFRTAVVFLMRQGWFEHKAIAKARQVHDSVPGAKEGP